MSIFDNIVSFYLHDILNKLYSSQFLKKRKKLIRHS